MEYAPVSDAAADILLTQRAAHGLLLTGHYSLVGVHHPGPFFLYIRLLGQWLTGGLTGSVFGAQLVGVLACNAVFAGLFAALLQRLAEYEGADGQSAAAAALTSLVLVLAARHHAIVSFWMPDTLILPFVTFLVAAMLTIRGNVFGLLAATFCTAALVHGYIPMPIVAGPIWLFAVAIGWRARYATTGRGFPRSAWVGAFLIFALFALPLVLDALIDPPGNIVRILETAAKTRRATPQPSAYQLAQFLGNQWRVLNPILWLVVIVGLVVAKVTGRYHELWRVGLILILLTTITSALAFAQAPTPLRSYSSYFFVAPALLAVALGALVTTLELEARHRLVPFVAVSSLLILSTIVKLPSPADSNEFVRALTNAIAAENPPGSRIELASPTKSRHEIPSVMKSDYQWLIAGLLLNLDRVGISACYRDSALSYYMTPERICSQTSSETAHTYWLERVPMCRIDAVTISPERIGRGVLIPDSDFNQMRVFHCLHIVPLAKP